MLVSDFEFNLPNERIALQPVEPRDAARLLVVDPACGVEGLRVHDLPTLIRSEDVLVINDTRVIPARLTGIRHRGASSIKVEVMLHKREDPSTWLAFARPGKKLSADDVISFYTKSEAVNAAAEVVCRAEVLEKRNGGEVLLRFSESGSAFERVLAEIGQTPLPPYIASKRAPDQHDESNYQTIFAKHSGAVAAPTAGLHFTDQLIDTLKSKGVKIVPVTLHVGAGTFLPVTAEDTTQHRMHSESGEISEESARILNTARSAGGRIIAVGTTSLRVLEASVRPNGTFEHWGGDIDLFITPGYVFRAVDVLMTNFHLPKSTLFMLVSAFSGLDTMRKAYQYAIDNEYRFYSYGDACLLFPGSLKV